MGGSDARRGGAGDVAMLDAAPADPRVSEVDFGRGPSIGRFRWAGDESLERFEARGVIGVPRDRALIVELGAHAPCRLGRVRVTCPGSIQAVHAKRVPLRPVDLRAIAAWGPTELVVEGCPPLRVDLRRLTQLESLHRLVLDGVGVRDRDLSAIGSLPLRHLDLSRNPVVRLGELGPLVELESLVLRSTGVGEATAGDLVALRGLRSLTLTRAPANDALLARIGELATLEELDLAGTLVTDDGAAALARLPLRRLDLSATFISPTGLRSVCAIPSLRQLRLDDTALSDAVVEVLLTSDLEVLTIERAGISEAALARLRTGLTRTTINGARPAT